MRLLFACMTLVLVSSAFSVDEERVKKQFKSDNYKVTWGPVATYDSNATLEIGDGNGHGFILGWMRFLPGNDGVDVLSVRLNEDRLPYKSKWPPDRAPVTIKRARMTPNAYRELLDDLAVVNAAKLKPVRRNSASSSSFDFWVYARLTAKEKTLLDLNWAGYDGSRAEIEYAKPRAAVRVATDAVKGLDFKEHSLTDAERTWASTKFARDWKEFEDLDFHWWVRERYIITIGVVGDATALPTLLNILDGDPKDRCVYYAINAVTRLTKQDLWVKPVEEMDVARIRRKILDAIQEDK